MSETNVITYDEALSMLQGAVREKGWYHVYSNPSYDGPTHEQSCRYVHVVDDGILPGCIVGTALLREGRATPELLVEYNIGAARTLFENLGLHATEEAMRLIMRVQHWQDKGVPWGAALVMAAKIQDTDMYVHSDV